MNPLCKKELADCTNIMQMIAVLNKYYDLEQNFGAITGALVKKRVTENFTSVIQQLGIKEKKVITNNNPRSLF